MPTQQINDQNRWQAALQEVKTIKAEIQNQ